LNDVKKYYLKERVPVRPTVILDKSYIGIICGLWANSLGMGGIIPIQTKFYPSKTLLEIKLTGMQGDVMKESMNVAKTLAYSLTPFDRKNELKELFEKTNCQGVHIHCPEGAVPKDGPSAGTAITTCIYSLLNNKQIKRDVAITGEITLNGDVTAIGGLKEKITGGIKAGVKTFLFPEQNKNDFNLICEKLPEILKQAEYHPISRIEEVFDYVFEN
jgi:ATP-dependent Lon protease